MNFLKPFANSKFWANKKNRVLVIVAMALMLLSLILFLIFRSDLLDSVLSPSITLMSPAPVSVSNREDITIDVVLSQLPDDNYPAASLSLAFDKNKLEFVGVKQGTMMTLGNSNQAERTYNIPIWKSDPAASNQSGEINTMYLDVTGGRFAYIADGFSKKDKDILLRLVFRLRDSVQAGEVYNITVKDAVIATVEGAQKRTSLATSLRTLKAYSAKIVVQ